jgi:hypothetical protein
MVDNLLLLSFLTGVAILSLAGVMTVITTVVTTSSGDRPTCKLTVDNQCHHGQQQIVPKTNPNLTLKQQQLNDL